MRTFWIVVLIIIIVIFGIWFIYQLVGMNPTVGTPPGATSTVNTTSTQSGLAFDQSISDGTIKITYPSADFGLATNQGQVLVHSYIPPCNTSFNYCLYYTGSAYQGTNFESAGLTVRKRTDLGTQSKCLTTAPDGYTGLTPQTASSSDYAVSVFSPIGDAAAGHFSAGAVYRLSYGGACYEFETRVGESDFGNYPSGTIQEFTSANQSALQSELQQILATLSIPSGSVSFPQAQS